MKLGLFLALFQFLLLIDGRAQDTNGQERIYAVPDINGRATLLIKPTLPADVTFENDGTTITLKVVVDKSGDVLSAKCVAGCASTVSAPAEAAAMASSFQPLLVEGRAVKYEGTLMYTIAVQRINWYSFGMALYSTYIFDNISLGPVAAMLTTDFADEKVKLQELDNGVALTTRWKTIEGVRDSIKGKLKGKDEWWFALGIEMREVTAPFQSDQKLNRDEVQKALLDLGKFTESAPSDIPKELIDQLKAVSAYKIDPSAPPQTVKQDIFRLVSKIRPDQK